MRDCFRIAGHSGVTVASYKPTFYEQVTDVKLLFSFIGNLPLLLVARHVALHRVSIRTLDELFIVQARCRLGFERRVDAAIYRTAFTAKVGSQSSEHGVIATGRHSRALCSLSVERYVWFLRDPDAVEENS
jgi:hypothetical protein